MDLNTVIARMPGWYAARKCVYLRSPPGRGKTTVFSEAPARIGKLLNKNLGLVIINGPLLTPADSVGYLVPVHHENGHTESRYTDPFWWVTSEGKRLEDYDGGIIVVDEADKMDTDVKKVIGEAALSGRLGPHKLPPGWLVWMAGNRSEDRSGSTKELDHLINRRMEIDVSDSIASWNTWAAAAGMMPLTMAFANQNVEIVFPTKREEKQGPWCTPRSLASVDAYLQVLKGDSDRIPDDASTVEEVAGMMGDGAAAQFFVFVRLEREMPKFERIVADPMKAKVPEKPDACMLVCYNLAHRVDKDTAEPVIKYIERLPKEFSTTFALAASQRDPMLVTTPAFRKWASSNASLIAIVSL